MAPPYGITPEGFSFPTSEEIQSQLTLRQRELISPVWVSEGGRSVAGVTNGLFSSHLAQAWEAIAAVFRQFDPQAAEGAALESAAALTGTLRLAARATVIPGVLVTLSPGTTYAAGSLVASLASDPTRTAMNSFDITVAGTGAPVTVLAQFEALNSGPIEFPTGQLTVRAVPVAGWSAVTNPSEAILGADIESYEDLRLRRESELAASGSSTLPGIIAALSRLRASGVTSVAVFANDTDTVDANGVNPRTFEAIVEGGTDAVIAKTIFDNKDPGDATQGSTSVVVKAPDGFEHLIRFTRPTQLPMYLAISVQVTSAFPGIDTFKAALETWAGSFFRSGDDVATARINAAAFMVPGVWNVPAVAVGTVNPPTTTGVFVITPRQRARFAVSRMLVTVVP